MGLGESGASLCARLRGDADQAERALAFYRSVGATRYVREGESLLPAQRPA
jgi:hypothetical protein